MRSTESVEDQPRSPRAGRRRRADSRGRGAVASRRRRWRRLLLISSPLIGFLIWGAVSYALWMLDPTSMTWSERSAEWVRTDVPLGNWIIDQTEHVYYTMNAPKKGGPQLKRLPAVGLAKAPAAGSGATRQTPTTSSHKTAVTRKISVWPPRIKPVFAQPLRGEGVWKPTGPAVNGGPPVLVTTFRPDPSYPEIVAYVAWFDHTRTALAYYPGRYEPPAAVLRGPMMVPDDQRWRLLASFNGGFTHDDGNNGSADNGRTNEPMIDGNATLVGYRSGRIAIVKWSAAQHVGQNVAWARQSLTPIVWNGRLNPLLDTDPNSPQWGYTLGGATRVWRTAVGIDRRGNVIYVVANDQTVISIAQILVHAGAVRGMEFDINPEWHTLITYSHQHGLDPTMVEPQPMQSADRYLAPDDRDFIAVYRRLPGPVSVPFS
ncbi:MAG TPA: phosphodiester glycosidase family protein [Solirubrobacteraceae bacterium]|nr:phosphodiester glycosidase family protein [Solirubrobacteraceae bacterium]